MHSLSEIVKAKWLIVMITGIGVVVAALCPAPRPVHACTQPVFTPVPVGVQVLDVPIVLEGTVIATDPEDADIYSQPYALIVEVDRYFKAEGRTPDRVRIDNIYTTTCDTPLEIGSHRIFYLQGDPADGLTLFRSGYYGPTIAASDENSEAIIAALGTDPLAPQKTVFDTTGSGQPNWLPLSLIMVSVCLVALIGGFILWGLAQMFGRHSRSA